MAKAPKVLWVCRECGGDHAKWQGQCAHCQAWNTLDEVQGAPSRSRGAAGWAGERGDGLVRGAPGRNAPTPFGP